jgi:prepilin-type N-terminal cleavage/methylation domain-containing protein/prepilin-type processing-associated H-X9-DG protein
MEASMFHPSHVISHPGRRGSHRRHGFTLIEVLVVVAILALLVAILLPSLAAARDRAKALVSATNLRSIQQGLYFYLQANNDTLPDSGHTWEVLLKYVQKAGVKKTTGSAASPSLFMKAEVYQCPGDLIPHTSSWDVRDPVTNVVLKTYNIDTSYGVNTSLTWLVRPSSGVTGVQRKMSTVKRPADIVSFCDSGDDDFNGAGPWILSEKNDVNNQVGHEIHHKTGNNFAYSDGHVQFHKAFLQSPPQYGLPPFPSAWIPNWDGVEYKNWVRDPPQP